MPATTALEPSPAPADQETPQDEAPPEPAESNAATEPSVPAVLSDGTGDPIGTGGDPIVIPRRWPVLPPPATGGVSEGA
jgi:hypothetical protein